MSATEVRHYRRVGAEEAHYNGYLVSAAHILQYVSDAVGELLIRHDGQGGLLATVREATFVEPVFAGEALEIIVKLVKVGNRSRTFEYEVYKHIEKQFDVSRSAARVVEPPALVSRGTVIGVIPREADVSE